MANLVFGAQLDDWISKNLEKKETTGRIGNPESGYFTAISSMLNFFQLGLGCLRMNLKAVTSCNDTKLSEADTITRSWDPVSV